MIMFGATCVASCLLSGSPAYAGWNDAGNVYDSGADTQQTHADSGLNASYTRGLGMDLAGTVGGSSNTVGYAQGKCSRSYTQRFLWSGSGSPTSFAVDRTDRVSGNASTVDNASAGGMGTAPSVTDDTTAGVGYSGTNAFDVSVTTSVDAYYAQYYNPPGYYTESVSLSAEADGYILSTSGGAFSAQGEASSSFGAPVSY